MNMKSLFSFLLLVCFAAMAYGQDVWTLRNILPSGENVAGIAFGNGKYVAVENYGIIRTSTDGIVWASRTGNSAALLSIAWGNNRFVAVGGGTILYSPDGETWTYGTGTGISKAALFSVAWGNNQFVAVGVTVGLGGTVLTSPDGVAWTSRNSGTSALLKSVAWGNNRFITVGLSNTVISSSDGIAWTPIIGVSANLSSVTWCNNQFINVGSGGSILTSPDGAAWTIRLSGTSQYLWGVCWGNDRFVAVGDSGTILSSADCATWTKTILDGKKTLQSITTGSNLFVAAGTSIYSSPFRTGIFSPLKSQRVDKYLIIRNNLIQYNLSISSSIVISIYGANGKIVRNIQLKDPRPGIQEIRMPTDLPNGRYLLSFRTSTDYFTKNIVIIR